MNINKTLVLTGIDFTSPDFRFVAKDEGGDEYWVAGEQVNCTSDCSKWVEGGDNILNESISDGWGFFSGLTNVSYKGYNGPLPRLDEDSSLFSEFDIYWKGSKIDNLVISDLVNMIKLEDRDIKISKTLQSERK